MRISFLSLIFGLIIGAILIGFAYYGMYWLWEKYEKIRHPFGKKKVEAPSPEQTENKNMLSMSEWLNTNDEDFISSENVFIRNIDGYCIAISENRKNLKLSKLNPTDKSQIWKVYFYKNPNDPYEEADGLIYNPHFNKYISFVNDTILLEDFAKPYFLNRPYEHIDVKCAIDGNKISNVRGGIWLTVEQNKIKTTDELKNASDFFVTLL